MSIRKVHFIGGQRMTREEAVAYWKQRSEHIHNWLKENEDVDFIGEYVEAIDMAIEAISAEAVQGEWESLKVVDISRSGVQELQEQQCSHCGKWLTTPYMYYPKKHNFCPNCGARMKGGAE